MYLKLPRVAAAPPGGTAHTLGLRIEENRDADLHAPSHPHT